MDSVVREAQGRGHFRSPRQLGVVVAGGECRHHQHRSQAVARPDRQKEARVPIFSVADLRVAFGGVDVVHGVSFGVGPGKTLAIVGESGSGKSVSLLGATGLLPPAASVRGSVLHKGDEILGLGAGARGPPGGGRHRGGGAGPPPPPQNPNKQTPPQGRRRT
ncbi:ATP-binding cassette domain-containing protein, partial [Mesorhizobium sp. M0011]|uniref:ATP-binding cassette domain-containing protein n=1 Tax=Mesorhizobium sp. M0011 TaxID=2956839 RepID=UPI0033394EFD